MTENPAPAERGEAPRWQIGRLAALGVTTARAVRLYEAAGAARGAGGGPAVARNAGAAGAAARRAGTARSG